MPLVYDDEPGSWDRLSEGWPETKEYAESKRVLCSTTKIVPYGSYVLMDKNTLRIETKELLKKLNKAYEQVRKSIQKDELELPQFGCENSSGVIYVGTYESCLALQEDYPNVKIIPKTW